MPRVREGGFYPQSLDKGLRSERALKLALAEMYVTGVSTRKIARVTQELCGFEVSSSDVSRRAAELDGELAAWREHWHERQVSILSRRLTDSGMGPSSHKLALIISGGGLGR